MIFLPYFFQREDDHMKCMHNAFACARGKGKVFVYNFQDADGKAIYETILKAVFESSHGVSTDKLKQGTLLSLIEC